ncbi:hypothetical protein [Streptomyces sp. SID13726]|uniref:GNAT family N-acetyltransferase n=1 Tax=Streptomyces sp. SID13726 TaxID=2706058 RepID=UPI0031BB25B9
MPQLAAPDVRFHASYLDAVREFTEAGLDPAVLESGSLGEYAKVWRDPEGFAGFVRMLRAETERPRRPDWVEMSNLWYVEGDTFLGRLSIRHRLTPELLELGGGATPRLCSGAPCPAAVNSASTPPWSPVTPPTPRLVR